MNAAVNADRMLGWFLKKRNEVKPHGKTYIEK
jgi:hypothetical protein